MVVVSKKKYIQRVIKNSKNGIIMGKRDICLELHPFSNIARPKVIYNQGAGWDQWMDKYWEKASEVKRDLGYRKGTWVTLTETGFLLKAEQGKRTSRLTFLWLTSNKYHLIFNTNEFKSVNKYYASHSE